MAKHEFGIMMNTPRQSDMTNMNRGNTNAFLLMIKI